MASNEALSQTSFQGEAELDSFQNTFVGRYNDLLCVFEKKASNLNEIVKVVESYVDIEKAYFQSFAKFITQNKNFATPTLRSVSSPFDSSNTFDSAFDAKLSDSWGLLKHWFSAIHSGAGTALRNFKSVKDELEKFNTEFDHEKKKLLSYLVSQQRELSHLAKKMFKARDKYYKACKEELNLPLPDTSKMASEKSHYETRLKATNDAFTKFFRVSFPQKLSEVRNSFVQRVVKVQTVLRSLITSKVESVHILDESINGQLLASLDAINVEEEVTELNKKYNPGNDPFDKVISFEFQEYSDKGHVSLQVIASSAAESPLHLIPAVSSQDTSSEGVQPQSVVPHHPHSSGHMRSRSEIDPSGSKVNDYTPSPITSRRSKSILKMFSSKRSGGHERTRSKSNEFDISQISSNVTSSESPSICIVGPPPATAAVAAADVSLHSTVVMKVPLDALVERERVLNPEANIPRVETFLVESLLALNAPAGVKGIFKRGGKVPFVNALKKSLDEGTFDAPNDPYVCADVLKFWVRSLPEPLIPNSLYEESVKCCTGDEAFNVFNQLKEPNKSVLGYLACFVSHVSTFAAETGVNDNALASVFSPCIMKCPYTDVKEMIAATEKQTFFVLGLLNAASSGLITSEEFKLSLAKTKPKAETPSSRNRNRSGEANSASDDDDDDDGNNNNGEEKPPPLPSTPPPLIPSCFSSPPPPPPSLSISNQQIK